MLLQSTAFQLLADRALTCFQVQGEQSQHPIMSVRSAAGEASQQSASDLQLSKAATMRLLLPFAKVVHKSADRPLTILLPFA